jgi:hypothetical protein
MTFRLRNRDNGDRRRLGYACGAVLRASTVSLAEFPELIELERIIAAGAPHLEARVACEVAAGTRRFPVHVLTLGNPAPDVPAVGFFGGFHGLERIGAEVVLAYLRSLVSRLRWDSVLHRELESVRLVFMPLVNPGGIWHGTRANPNGVDLMRNSPLESRERVPFLIGGQRLSPGLPWYRGPRDAPMEAESQAVCRVVETELLTRDFSLAVDCHSGFGIHDRIWFPYAHTALPIAHLAEIHALKHIYDQTYSHHSYLFEPQSRQYLAHGDLWDYLYQRAAAPRIFLPLTLEMGSWLWVKKNPRQLFSRHGIFNPLIGHRQQRVLRRHLPWLDFLARAAAGCRRWLPAGSQRERHHETALALWYRGSQA